MRPCQVTLCTQPHRCRGYCAQHYEELFRQPIMRSKELCFVDISPSWQNALGELIRALPDREKGEAA